MSRLWFVCAVVILAGSVSASTLRVPSDYPTIRRAVFEAAEDDTVLVAPGTYLDRFTIRDKNVVLRGAAGAEATVIDGSIAAGNVITLIRTDRSMIVEDLTVTGGSFNSVAVESTGAAIYVNQGQPTIQRCRLVENDGNAAGGIDVYFFSQPLIRDCFIAHNAGGGVFIETDTGLPGPAAEISNCTIVRNLGYGVTVIKGARLLLESSTVAYNVGDGVHSEITLGAGDPKCYVTVRKCIVSHNVSGGIVRGLTLGTCYTLECNDVWGNNGVQGGVPGNYVGYSPADPCFSGRGSGDVSFDPTYQDAANDNYLLSAQSPLYQLCQAGSCGAVGAGTRCTDPVLPVTWSAVKLLYR